MHKLTLYREDFSDVGWGEILKDLGLNNDKNIAGVEVDLDIAKAVLKGTKGAVIEEIK